MLESVAQTDRRRGWRWWRAAPWRPYPGWGAGWTGTLQITGAGIDWAETQIQKIDQIMIFPDRPRFICTEDQKVSAFLLTSLGVLGVTANIILIIVICFKGSFKRWTSEHLYWILELQLWQANWNDTVRLVNVNYHNFSWTNGLLFHQAVVDLARSAILIPLGNFWWEITRRDIDRPYFISRSVNLQLPAGH